jgi:integrase
MPRKAAGLTAAKVRTAAPGRYGDGDGLYLFVRSADARFWVFRYTRQGKMREMGLGRAGGTNAVTLAQARDKAGELHRLVKAGIDPLDKRANDEAAAEAAIEAAKAAAARRKTLRTVVDAYLTANEARWKNAKHKQQWRNTLDTYVLPVCGDRAVEDVGTEDVTSVLEPIWNEKPETASRVRGRLEAILDYAKVMSWRDGENPARWRGHLALAFPKRSQVRAVEHHAALPWREIGTFMVGLRSIDSLGARALELTILTAARTGEVLGARWSEIDTEKAVWTIPAERMKAKKEHRVPLSAAALTLLDQVKPLRDDATGGFVFPGARRAKPLSNMALLMLLRRMERDDITTHGFRSTFRDWVAEATTFPGEVAEAALAHTLPSKVQAAYQRGDQLAKRRELMDAWAAFCARVNPDAAVQPILAAVA